MSTSTTVRIATLPRVNLLPPEIADDQRFRRIQGLLAVVMLGALGVIAFVYVGVAAQQSAAQDELAVARDRQSTLQRQVNKYAEVPRVYGEVAKGETHLAAAMGSEVRWSSFLSDLDARIPANTWLTKVVMTQNDAAAPGATVSGVETGGPVIGKVSFSGVAISPGRVGNHSGVATWLEALGKQKKYANGYFTSSTTGKSGKKNVVEFESTADVNEQALSRRYSAGKGK